MTGHDDQVRLRHMIDYAREATTLCQDKSRQDLDQNRLLQLGLVRLIEIIGEAAARMSKATQTRYTHIPWAQITGMRNRLIHGYDAVDYDILWQTIKKDLPELIIGLEQTDIAE